jgi:transportin-1
MHPRMVAPVLPDFAQAWCQALYEIRDNEEKDSAFRGLCTLVQVNPMGIAKVRRMRSTPRFIVNRTRTSLQSLMWFCNAIVRWNQPSEELNSMFQTLLNGFKVHDPQGWAAQVQTFPPVIQERLAQRYGV